MEGKELGCRTAAARVEECLGKAAKGGPDGKDRLEIGSVNPGSTCGGGRAVLGSLLMPVALFE